MTNMLDGFEILSPVNLKETCPICGKGSHPDKTTTDKKEGKGCLKSIPANLDCEALDNDRDDLPNFTTAAHHLIPVNQCLKQFPRLSQMCKTAGYDVNNKKNGISLPTCAQKDLNNYEANDGKLKKYGKLSDDEKENVAFHIMTGLDLQWHVGHHNWKSKKIDLDTDGYPHVENYDKLVKTELRDIELKFSKEGGSICDPQDDKESGKKIIEDMNELSIDIGKQVERWNKFFVSALAEDFSSEYK